MVFQFASELGANWSICRQFNCQLLETAVEGADFFAHSLVELLMCARYGEGAVVMPETADLCQLGNTFPDYRVATTCGANHEEDRPRIGVGEDFFDVVLKC